MRNLCRLRLGFRRYFSSHHAAQHSNNAGATYVQQATRIVPKLSAFTGNPAFYEAYNFLLDALKRLQQGMNGQSMPAKVKEDGPRCKWYSLERMAETLGFSLTQMQYTRIVAALDKLAMFYTLQRFSLKGPSPDLVALLNTFTSSRLSHEALTPEEERPVTSGVAKEVQERLGINLGHIDKLGRAISIGRRKSASARVYLVPGAGLCYVNGRPANEYFPRMQEMFVVAEPFRIAKAFGRFNAWCQVRGGGHSGQAGAICNALSRALYLMAHDARAELEASNLMKRDPRTVERKKPGQPKARKKFTWVKR